MKCKTNFCSACERANNEGNLELTLILDVIAAVLKKNVMFCKRNLKEADKGQLTCYLRLL